MLPLQPHNSTDPDTADQSCHAIAQRAGAVERVFDDTWIAEPCGDLAHDGPIRPFDTLGTVPFRIARDHDTALIRRHRAAATQLRLRLIRLALFIVAVTTFLLLDPQGIDE